MRYLYVIPNNFTSAPLVYISEGNIVLTTLDLFNAFITSYCVNLNHATKHFSNFGHLKIADIQTHNTKDLSTVENLKQDHSAISTTVSTFGNSSTFLCQ